MLYALSISSQLKNDGDFAYGEYKELRRWLWYGVTGRGFRDADITSVDRSVRIEVASEVAGADLEARLTFHLRDVGRVDRSTNRDVVSEIRRADWNAHLVFHVRDVG